MQPEEKNRRGQWARAGNLELSSRDECSEHIANTVVAQGSHFVPMKRKPAPDFIANPGVRKKRIDRCAGIKIVRWPAERKLQHDVYEAWLDIAMQILYQTKTSFRLVAVIRSFLFWKKGEIHASDAQLAERAGRCSVRSMSRDIAAYRALGVIKIEHGWRVLEGRRLRTRVIRLSVPDPIPAFVVLSETDTCVSTWIDDQDRHTGVVTDQTHGCLITLAIEKGGPADG